MSRTLEIVLPHEARAQADDRAWLTKRASRAAGCHPDSILEVRVVRRSLDARSKRLRWRFQVRYWQRGEDVEPEAPVTPPVLPAPRAEHERVLVVGSGPAGLFAALTLAGEGVPVVLLERGKDVQARRHDLARITRGIAVDPDSNYCFGEGGAGTYSDGKLYTRSGRRADVEEVLRVLVAHGAPRDILVDARPHIGSNRLPEVVQAIRRTLTEAGVDYRFESRVVDLLRDEAGALAGLAVQKGGVTEELEGRRVILATGHGARDVHEILRRHGVSLEAKAFAMGVRAEHPQPQIDDIQFGCSLRPDGLPAAAYSVTATVAERGVYSFCMCPGGWIVPSMTEEGALVLNGMSLSRRDSPFANSGIVVAVEPQDLVGEEGRRWGVEALGLPVPPDLESAGPLHGAGVQAALEQRAWDAGGGQHRAPAQRLVDFLEGRASENLPASSYQPGLTPVTLAEFLPSGIHERLRDALRVYGRSMPGTLSTDAVLTAVESRTSSPVRVLRHRDTLESPGLPGLHPAG